MPDFVTLSCPSCGTRLQISNELSRFACSHCGNEHVVKRSGGIVSLDPVVEQLKNVRTGVDKTASELAIKRLKDEIETLKNKRDNVHTSSGCLSSLLNPTLLFFMFIVAFIGAALIGSYVYTDVDIFGWCCGGLLVIIIPTAIYMDYKSKQEGKLEIENFNKLISEKDKELQYHEKIVRAEPITQPRKLY